MNVLRTLLATVSLSEKYHNTTSKLVLPKVEISYRLFQPTLQLGFMFQESCSKHVSNLAPEYSINLFVDKQCGDMMGTAMVCEESAPSLGAP